MENVPVVILCGGLGTRLQEETKLQPKPMVEIDDKPILWHIMKIYAHYGFNEFILALGYKKNVIKEYFYNHKILNNDFTINLGKNNEIFFHNNSESDDWKVTLVDTGLTALKGARIKKIEKFVTGERFMLTYGDGLADINIKNLLTFHKNHGKIGTVTSVKPPSRFGEITIEGNQVTKFSEKPIMRKGSINGGFFVFEKAFFDYLENLDNYDFEHGSLEKLAKDGQMIAYKHDGFWQCMDTIRDVNFLQSLALTTAPWKVWKK
jgi:glucose-1-phosphate cytidylyltransferase